MQVPFGEVTVVKEWLKVCGAVFKPEAEHPKKPVLGLTCTRIEVCLHKYCEIRSGLVHYRMFHLNRVFPKKAFEFDVKYSENLRKKTCSQVG